LTHCHIYIIFAEAYHSVYTSVLTEAWKVSCSVLDFSGDFARKRIGKEAPTPKVVIHSGKNTLCL
jgi:hypothetical protein